jgi:acyl-coenzyme A thioesterase PaaI-like protein
MQPIPPDRIPEFNRTLGMTSIRSGGGEAEIEVEMHEGLTNKRGVAHGGLVAVAPPPALT